MSESSDAAVLLRDALVFLQTTVRDGVGPEEALSRLTSLRERHPGAEIVLLWERERHARAVHYDLLLRQHGIGGTISLGVAPDRATPWLLRAASHSAESEIARVNSRSLDIQRVVSYLDALWGDARLMQRMVDDLLVDEAIDELRIEPSAAHVQGAMDAFRRARRLHSAEQTRRWMDVQGLSRAQLERLVTRDAAEHALRERVADDDHVTRYFERNARQFDTADIARLRVETKEEAARLTERIRAGELDFFQAAQDRFLDGASSPGRTLFATLRRGDLSPEQAALIFDAAPGAVLLIPSERSNEVVRVFRVTPARLDDATRSAIRDAHFDDWLAERRSRATVEWFWGYAREQNQSALVPGGA